MTRLIVRLLGGYRVELDGKAVYGFETDKARALLAYLLTEGDRPHRRETLAALLWPDRPDTVARANLRQTLASLRRALSDYDPPFFIFVSRTDLQFNTASDHLLDVTELEAFALASDANSQPLPEALCADFLAGFSIPDSEAFEAWVLNRQEYCHRLALSVLDAQNARSEARGDYARAVAAARLELRMEPWLEEAHRRCMRGLALAGRRAEALRQYELCCQALKAELGVEPAGSTRALYVDILEGREPGARKERSHGGSDPHPRPIASREQPQQMPEQADGRALRDARPAEFVAREDELGQLNRDLLAMLAGATRVVFVSGDAGSGKTALVEAFAATAMADHPELLVSGARCNPGGSLDAFALFRRLAETLFGQPEKDISWRLPGESAPARLREATDLLLAALAEQGPDLIGTLLPDSSVARRASTFTHGPGQAQPRWWRTLRARLDAAGKSKQPSIASLESARSQGALSDAIVRTLAAIAREKPLLLILDDLHWVDEASAALLVRLGREMTESRLLVVAAYRSATVSLVTQDAQSLKSARHPMAVAVNELRRIKGDIVIELDRADGRAFVEAYLNSQPNRLGGPFRDALYAQTGGHALFTVELLRSLQERGELVRDEAGRWVARDALDWGGLPARVDAAIAERIDRVPPTCRRILAAASAQGEQFSAEMAAELTGLPLREVIAALSGDLARQHLLVRPEGLQRVGRSRVSMYRFAHHLFQKYLYDQLDPVERAQMHAAVGSSLDRQIGDDAAEREPFSTRLAWHYEKGGLTLPAARALLEAGRAAMRVAGFREALNCFDHGLALLADEPQPAASLSPGWSEIERLLQVARLIPLRNLGTVVVSDPQSALAEADPGGSAVFHGQGKLIAREAEVSRLVWSGHLSAGLAFAGQMLEWATLESDEDAVVHARYWLAFVHNLTGNALGAAIHFHWILDRRMPGGWTKLRAAIGYEIAVHALTFFGINQWLLGYPDQARGLCAEALRLALELRDPFGQVFSAACGSMVLFMVRDDVGLQRSCELCQKVCDEWGIAPYQHFAAAMLGWMTTKRDQDAGGVDRIAGALARWRNAGIVVGTDPLAAVLADACLTAADRGRLADPGECARLVTIGLAAVEPLLCPDPPSGQAYQPELHRLRGELLLARDGLGVADEALASFHRALDLARERQLLGWALRAAMSVVRLRQRQGPGYASELAEAQRTLGEAFGRFTEGFHTPDLREAAALLAMCPPRLPGAG